MRPLLTAILILTLWQTHAQVDLVNRTVQRKDSNLIFRGFDNTIEVVGGHGSGWQLKARNKEIVPTDSPRLFTVRITTSGPDTIRLIQNGKTMFSKVFWVTEVPSLVVRLGALTKNTATVPEVIANGRIVAFWPGCNCDPIRILSFEITCVTAQLTNQIKLAGNALTQEAIQRIRQLKPGDKIIFSEIIGMIRGGCPHMHSPFTITITSP